MTPSWLSAIPVFIVISITFATQQLNMALIIGIALAALITANWQFLLALNILKTYIINQLSSLDSWYLYGFLIILPSLIDLFIQTGSATAFALMITKKIKSKRGIQFASIITSCALAIDDYLSIITTGHVIRSLTDQVGIPRVKLAYLIHALSGNVVILVCFSSWVATLTNYLKLAGVGKNHLVTTEPFALYIQSIPFMAYPILTIIAVFTIVYYKISFGTMKKEEDKNIQFTAFTNEPTESQGKARYLFAPLLLLLSLIVGSILYYGDCFIFGGEKSIFEAFTSNTNIFFILFFASKITFLLTISYYLHAKISSCKSIIKAITHSFQLMKSVLLMIFLVAVFSSLLRSELGTGIYFANIAVNHITLPWMPAIFFILATVIAFSTGTSWGTFGLLLPIGIPMIVQMNNLTTGTEALAIPLLCPTIGAIFSGALCGDHLSLFSETTAMSAAAVQVKPIDHFWTQLPYGIPVIIGSLLFFILSGVFYDISLWKSFIINQTIAITIVILLLHGLHNYKIQ
ncbi:hypothetical protein EKK58_06935 [Candidatus Dependentiae bacterium]|nr:MAG: hypothetical protein EKK58_06935 [Candidatus Dependentiae bacterium]